MGSFLIREMMGRHRIQLLAGDGFEEVLARAGDVVLFFTGDPERVRESDDVAMILPELLKVFPDRLRPFVVDRDIERPLQARYRFTAWPALVFLRRGAYLGAISRVRDWPEYLDLIGGILAGEPVEPPPFDLQRACAAGSS